MPPFKSTDIRKAFLDFFAQQEHRIVPTSSLVPQNDPTLLFTNAGMVQFKDVFLGLEKRPYQRATSAQRCVRAGGKHNDLDNVGYTARHHTFFEMLGNFSFGDYFKRDAIRFAWTFLTEVLKLPHEKLWVTVYEKDDEAADIWLKEMKIDATRFSRCGEADNFWAMGDTGPCGPCTEIFYDHGAEIPGGPPGSPDADGDRYIEIWNLVFMQYERNAQGELKPLPKPSVDTGMGFERIAAVLQGVHNNYETDLFIPLIQKIASLANISDLKNTSLRVIADHIRATSFLITDGVQPSNEGRGYVLRRIMRRALRHGHHLGLTDTFFYQLVPTLVSIMGEAYPELAKAQNHVMQVIQREEEQFARTLSQGMKIFEQEVAILKNTVIPGDIVFRLYDTYGFPVDLTADIARERNLSIDEKGFEQAMKKQREQSQAASQFTADMTDIPKGMTTEFGGYTSHGFPTTLQHIYYPSEGTAILILEKTPFYAEGGGQVGDKGVISTDTAEFQVEDTQKQGAVYLHKGRITKGTFEIGNTVYAQVNENIRMATMANHSATHLLDSALIKFLGSHVQQKGSLVTNDRLRFDFTNPEPVSEASLEKIESWVNEQIRRNLEANVQHCSMEEARTKGAIAMFGEKYGDVVRVMQFGDASIELCGGTHVNRTGDIGFFKIISESGIAAGIRRIEALTGEAVRQYATAELLKNLETVRLLQQQLHELRSQHELEKPAVQPALATAIPENAELEVIFAQIKELQESQKQLWAEKREIEKEIERIQQKKLAPIAQTLSAKSAAHADGKFLLHTLTPADGIEVTDAKTVRELAERLQAALGEKSFVVLSAAFQSKVAVVASVGKSWQTQYSADTLLKTFLSITGGKGGGKPGFAQGNGEDATKIDAAFEAVHQFLKNN